jgi:hypothetical protein
MILCIQRFSHEEKWLRINQSTGIPFISRLLVKGSRVRPISSTGPADLRDLVPDLAVTPAQKSRDLLYREAAHEHVAQLGQLRIRPFPAGVPARWFLSLGPLRIDDERANQPEERISLGTLRPPKEIVGF